MNARTTILPVALLALASHAHANQAQTPIKVPATLPTMEDVKTQALAYPKEAAPAASVRGPAPQQRAVSNHGPDTRANTRATTALPPVITAAWPYPMHDVDEAGTQWVRGRTYKASFGADGATYIPFLGSKAPRNFPVNFRLSSVTAGDVSVAFDASPRAERDGEVVSLNRGALVEQYVIDGEGVEQRFVFDDVPQRGELVVAMDVTTELVGRADRDGFVFENELGHVSYGRAFAFDARGSTIGIDAQLVDGQMRLTVPASFVVDAVFPLTVDPYSGTFSVDTDSDDDRSPDVAYEASANALFVVYDFAFSATDHDIYARKYVNGNLTNSTLVDTTTNDWRNPRVAANRLAGQFLCVAEVGTSPTRIIRGREIDSSSTLMAAAFTISGTETGDKRAPDVGGDPESVGPTYYCVVWQRDLSTTDTDVHARLVQTNSTLLGASTIFLENSGATLDRNPAISNTNGLAPFPSQTWNIVWEHETTTSTDTDLQGAQILWDGTITTPTFAVATSTADEAAPAVSEPSNVETAGRPCLVLYTLDSDLRLRVFDGTAVLGTYDYTAALGQAFGAPAVASDGGLWLTTFTSRTGAVPFLDTDLSAATVGFVNGSFAFPESFVLSGSSSVNEVRPAMASSLGASNPYFGWVAYETNTLFGTGDIHAAGYDSPVNAGAVGYCGGTNATCPCGNGGTAGAGCANASNPNGALLGTNGYFRTSDDTCELLVFGVPATATVLFFQGNTATGGSTFGDGLRCAGNGVIRLGIRTASGGSCAFGYPVDTPIHVGGLIPGAGGWRYYQAWYRDSAPFCTASNFNLSNGLGLLWSP